MKTLLRRLRRPAGLDKGVYFFDPYAKVIGGGQAVTLAVAAELQRRGITVRIVTTGEGALARAAEKAGIPSVMVDMPGPLRTYGHATVGTARLSAAAALPLAWSKIARVLRPMPSLVHVTDLRGLILCGPPARILGLPVVWHLHATEPEPLLNSLAGRLSTATVVPSRNTLSLLPPAVRRHSRVVHNAVPRHALDAPQARFDGPLVVTAGRISAEKGVDVLLEAACTLVESVPGARVRVFGDVQPGWEEYHSNLLERIQSTGLGDRFELAGFVDRPSDEWSAASVYVQPSRREGLPLAVIEAMATGLPVVATDVGGLPELVEDGVSGVLVPPDNPQALAKGIADLLNDPDRCRRLGQAGRQRVEQLYSTETMVDSLMDIYREVL